jgi:nitrate/nitrite-specific signal transduction histidine kinase
MTPLNGQDRGRGVGFHAGASPRFRIKHPRLRLGSLRTRILAWAFVPTMIFLGAVAVYTFYTYLQVTERLVLERNEALTHLLAGQMGVEMTQHVTALGRLAATSDLMSGERAYQETALQSAIGELRDFDGGVVVLDANGRVNATSPTRRDLLGQNWSDRAYVQRLMSNVHPFVYCSDIEYDGPDGRPIIAVAIHIHDAQRRLVGLLVGMFELQGRHPSVLYRSLWKFAVRSDSHAYLVDSRGRLFDYWRREYIGWDISDRPVVRELLAGNTGSMRTYSLDGEVVIASYAPVPDTPWGLIEEEDWAALTRDSRRYAQGLLALLVLGMIIPALMVTLGMRRIIGPIAALTNAAQRMAQGQLNQRIETPPGDELGDLAAAFNDMSAQLRELYANLEQQVAERTAELATLNRIAQALSQSLDLETTYKTALDELLAKKDGVEPDAIGLDADSGMAYDLRQEGESQTLHLVAQRHLADEGLDTVATLPVTHDAIADAITSGEPQRIAAPASASREDALHAIWVRAGWQTVLALPLTAKGRPTGLLFLGTASPARTPLSAEQWALLRSLGQQIGVAVENAHLVEQAEQSAVQAERTRLARELHDSVTQTLFSANLIAGIVPLLWDADPVEGRRRLEELQQLTQGALAEMRMLLLELRPEALASSSLPDLLSRLAEAVTARARVPVTFSCAGDMSPLAEGAWRDVRIALYRIAQEALNNMAKHAGASAAKLILNVRGPEPIVALEIADNGRGFDPSNIPAGHLGVKIMRERAEAIGATLHLASKPGRGTRITVTWPAQER